MLRRSAVVALAVFALACGSQSKPETKPAGPSKPVAKPATKPAAKAGQLDPATFTAQLDAYIASIGKGKADAKQFSGLVFVAQGDKVIYDKGWGYSDRATKTKADRNTSFRIGSVTKQFTAVAILQLQERGLLSVKDPIKKHLPTYPAVGGDITIHQLLTHTGGLFNYTNDKSLMKSAGKPRSVPDLMATFWKRKLDFKPGSKFSYSNSGYVVLGAIVEAVAKKSYHDYVRDHLFGPAGMTRSHYGDAKGLNNRARGYKTKDGKIVAADKIAMSNAYAAGGVRSTAADMWRWHKAVETDKLLKPESRKQMYTVEKSNYAYGWGVRVKDGKRVIAHDGGIHGFGTSYMRIMEDDIAIVIWTNNPTPAARSVRGAVSSLAMGKKVEPIKHNTADAATAKRIVGSYVMTDDSRKRLLALAGKRTADSVHVLDIQLKDGEVMSKPIGQPPRALSHKNGLVLELQQVRATFTFKEKAPGGVISGFSLGQGGMTFDFVRDAKKAAAIKAARAKAKSKKVKPGKKK